MSMMPVTSATAAGRIPSYKSREMRVPAPSRVKISWRRRPLPGQGEGEGGREGGGEGGSFEYATRRTRSRS
jgi:hypothetical protein